MTRSRTKRLPAPPILGGLLGVKGGYVTEIRDGANRHAGYGKTPAESQRNASKNRDRKR
jgi:hypothetical protein